MEHRALRRAVFALLAAALAAHVAQLTLGIASGAPGTLLNQGLYKALIVTAALVCLARAWARRADRLAWAALGLGMAAWAAADIYWSVALADMAEAPYPSLADAGWLAFYPASYAAVLVLSRRGRGPVPPAAWLDGTIAALGASAMTAAVLFEPILAVAVDGSPAVIATNLAYPVGDLLLLALVVGVLAADGWRLDRMWALFGAGLVLSAIADSWYLAALAKGTYSEGSILNALWPAAALLLAWSAWQPRRARAPVVGGRRVVVLPAAFAFLGLGLLVYDHFERINNTALVLATLTLAAVVVRMVLAFRVNARMLEASRREAVTDALTGLGNRRHLMSELEAALHGDDHAAGTLALFDLDGFKRYNDAFGHPAGDALLQRLAGKLARAVDGHGRAFRMGGDEFCVLLGSDGTDPGPLVAAAAEALTEHGRGFAIGASHGSLVLMRDASSAPEALQIADQRMYAHKAGRSAARTSETRDVLMRVLREREPRLHEHLAHVADLARGVARRLGLTPEAIDEVARAAELHDVGKMAVPDAILSKPGPLDEDEWRFIRRHTLIGEEILSAAPALVPVAKIVRASHERFDGRGYPDALAGDDIPLAARIVAVCDAFDAMISERAYRSAMTVDAAVRELRRGAGTQFDPDVVASFCDTLAAAPARLALP